MNDPLTDFLCRPIQAGGEGGAGDKFPGGPGDFWVIIRGRGQFVLPPGAKTEANISVSGSEPI